MSLRHDAAVRVALMLFLVAGGIVLLPACPWLGMPMILLGMNVATKVNHEDVSRFVGVVFYLGVIGFIAALFVGDPTPG